MKLIRILITTVAIVIASGVSAQDLRLQGLWKFRIGDQAQWAAKNFDDSAWEKIQVPAPWEENGFNRYDGFAWYRIAFDGRKLNRETFYYLNLGYIDDSDEAFLNGTLIGFSGHCPPGFKTAFNVERRYVLPSQLIDFNGMNTLAVRVFDVTHRGGITSGNIGIFEQPKSENLLINLQGIWRFSLSKRGEMINNENLWQNIMVPGPWEHQGFPKYDGFAWYKKSFTIPENFTKEPIVLLLGRIDDFDKVYFNGKLIGVTNDHREFGGSQSFSKQRVYEIPQEIIKRNGTNTVEILVEDIGNIGGIYEGVIGITTRASQQRYFDE